MERYFIGISPPAEVSESLRKLQRKHHKAKLMLEPLEPHITLLHPNALSHLEAEKFLPMVRRVSRQFLPFDVTLHEVSMYGKRVLFCSIDSPQLVGLQASLIKLLPERVIRQFYEGRPYQPHLTIAQSIRGKRLPEQLTYPLEKDVMKLLPHTFSVTHLHRFEWEEPRIYKSVRV
jgi:2'-5' RNA ligase